jgi:hypothetical protein
MLFDDPLPEADLLPAPVKWLRSLKTWQLLLVILGATGIFCIYFFIIEWLSSTFSPIVGAVLYGLLAVVYVPAMPLLLQNVTDVSASHQREANNHPLSAQATIRDSYHTFYGGHEAPILIWASVMMMTVFVLVHDQQALSRTGSGSERCGSWGQP